MKHITLFNDEIHARQIALVCACILPSAKLLEVPSLLAKYSGGDLLLPALLHFLLQGGILFALLYASSRSEIPLFERMERLLGRWSYLIYALLGIYYLFAGILPLLDLEKFIYAAFFDTSPTTFSFTFFFFLSAFLCTKGLKAFGRFADLSLFLYAIPFLLLIALSVSETDLTHLLPLFEKPFGDTMSAFTYTTPHFSDAILLLPLLGNLRYKKGDSAKIMCGYGVGALSSLLFFAVFFGIFSSIAPREHYAFSKIAQYFPTLSIIGRVDLFFVYSLTIVLLIFTSLTSLYTVDFTCRIVGTKRRVFFSAILNIGLFFFVFYCNKYYNFFYALIAGKLPIVFWFIADMVPLLLLFLPKSTKTKPKNKERIYA